MIGTFLLGCAVGIMAWEGIMKRPKPLLVASAPTPTGVTVRVVKRIAHGDLYFLDDKDEWTYVGRDFVLHREDDRWHPADRRLLDELTHVTENWGRGKW